MKRIGRGRARKLTELPDGSQTNSVFSSDGRRVAALIANGGIEQLMAIDLANRRKTELADSFEGSGHASGPSSTWQPTADSDPVIAPAPCR